MANEIYSSLTLRASKNGAKVSFSESFRADMANNEMIQSTQVIGTTAEEINIGDIAADMAAVVIKNLDATNYIEIGGDSGLTVFKIKLMPGQFCIFRPTNLSIYAKANTADVRVQVVAIEE